jgi:hypothetical protein
MSNNRISLIIATAIGGGIALLSTVLPWYSFDVVLPVPGIVHVFAVGVTLWGFTTVAPILLLAGAVVALSVAVVADRRLAGAVVGLIGLGIAVYAVVRWIEVPNLGIGFLPGHLPAVTQVDSGPFAALAGGVILLVGAVADLVTSPAEARSRRSAFTGQAGPSVPPPQATA